MKAKRVARRARAERDIDAAAERYFTEGGVEPELRFIAAFENAIRHLAAHPATGSPRYAIELGLPGLRLWKLRRFPHLVFYVERVDHVDVWRVLHGARDLPAWLQDVDEGP